MTTQDHYAQDDGLSFRRSLAELPARWLEPQRSGTKKWKESDTGRGFYQVYEAPATYDPDRLARRHDIATVAKKKSINNFNHRRPYLAEHVNPYDSF